MERNYRQEIEKILKVITGYCVKYQDTFVLEGYIGDWRVMIAESLSVWRLYVSSKENPHYLEIDSFPLEAYPASEMRAWYESKRDAILIKELFNQEVDCVFRGIEDR